MTEVHHLIISSAELEQIEAAAVTLKHLAALLDSDSLRSRSEILNGIHFRSKFDSVPLKLSDEKVPA